MTLFSIISSWVGKRIVSVGVGISVAIGLLRLISTIQPVMMKSFLDSAVKNEFNEKILLIIFFISITSILLDFFLTYFYGKVHTLLETKVRLAIYKKSTYLSSKIVKQRGEGYFSKMFEDAVTSCMNIFVPSTYFCIFDLLKSFIILIIVFYYDIFLSFILFCLIISHILNYVYNRKRCSNKMNSFYTVHRETSSYLIERLGLVSLIEAYPSFRITSINQMKEKLYNLKSVSFQVEMYWETIYCFVERFLQPIVRYSILGYLGYKIISDDYTIGTVLMLFTYIGMIELGMSGLSNISELYLKAKVSVETIKDFLAEPIVKQSINKQRISFFYFMKDVYFSHSAATRFGPWSAELQKGICYGLVGKSGVGKTSLIEILLGKNNSLSGEIYYLNKENIPNLCYIDEDIVYLGQNALLINGTIVDNITLGDDDSSCDIEKLIDSLELGHLRNRNIGFNGARVSGGEKRKINIARFIYFLTKRDSYIIDEAFLELDNQSKDTAIQMIKKEIRGKSGIVVSHDTDVISHLADQVIFQKNDSLVLGSHDDYINTITKDYELLLCHQHKCI